MAQQDDFSPHVNGDVTGDVSNAVQKQESNDSNLEDNFVQPNVNHSTYGLKLLFIMIALMLSIFLASTDETATATGLGAIVDDFKSTGEVTWIAASYLLTMTAFQPLYGKFSDIFGRKTSLLFALAIFLVGSLGCGLAPNIITLIVFRSFAGIGAGGLISLSFIIISGNYYYKTFTLFLYNFLKMLYQWFNAESIKVSSVPLSQ